MRRRMAVILLLAVLSTALCGCGSVYDKEYLVIAPYPPNTAARTEEDRISIGDPAELRNEILRLVYDGSTEGLIVFDAAYQGDPAEDMASACWQARTQNALCAYCVENISYEISHVLTYDEAKVHISYAESAVAMDEIYRLSYTVGVDELIKDAMQNSLERIVILITNSSYNEEKMKTAVMDVYHEYPTICVLEPSVSVTMYSGTFSQRLYEIRFNFKLDEEKLAQRKKALEEFDPWEGAELQHLSQPEKALLGCTYLVDHCEYSTEAGPNSAYLALIDGKANSEGLSLAYVELCRQMGIPCSVVYGQRDWKDHCWNIIQLGGDYYHVDVSACISEGMINGFLRSDEAMWQMYRWDISSYSPCSGRLRYSDVAGSTELTEEESGENELPAEVPEDESAPEDSNDQNSDF